VPIISTRQDYNGFLAKAERLGLVDYIEEAESTLTCFDLLVEETKHANGTRGIRQQIDTNFAAMPDWTKISSGGIDWTKESDQGLSIGVEVQVSGRSDMLAVDILHLSQSLQQGRIDVGLIVVPDDRLSKFLTDRTPNLATAIKHVEQWGAQLPIRVIAFLHDGAGPALPKAVTNLGKSSD